ncbi:MAG: hypothetical protein ACSLFR_05205 [Solirubrobacteraceae bacterium]
MRDQEPWIRARVQTKKTFAGEPRLAGVTAQAFPPGRVVLGEWSISRELRRHRRHDPKVMIDGLIMERDPETIQHWWGDVDTCAQAPELQRIANLAAATIWAVPNQMPPRVPVARFDPEPGTIAHPLARCFRLGGTNSERFPGKPEPVRWTRTGCFLDFSEETQAAVAHVQPPSLERFHPDSDSALNAFGAPVQAAIAMLDDDALIAAAPSPALIDTYVRLALAHTFTIFEQWGRQMWDHGADTEPWYVPGPPAPPWPTWTRPPRLEHR